MIEFACHTWAFNDLRLPEALGTIARLGFRYVDIGSGTHINSPKAASDPEPEAATIRTDLDAFNLTVSDLYIMLPRISLADDERRRKEVDLFKALVPFAVALGAPGVTVSPGLAQPPEDENAHERTAESLREMLEATQAAGLRLSIEPHLDSIAPTPDRALQFIKDVPGLEITLDWAHMIAQGIRRQDTLTLLPYTRHVQMRSAARNRLQTPFDKGKLDLPRIVSDLHAANYDGVISVEYMNMPGWHGMVAVNAVGESAHLRDALRDARDAQVDGG